MFVLLELLAGLALLVMGRRLFWLFVAVAGFLIGATLAPRLFPQASQAVILIVALGLGVAGALLALTFQRLAVGLAGFLIGGYLGLLLGGSLGLNTGSLPTWFFFLVGGIIGAALVVALFDWALIILSAITGAALITSALQTAPRALDLGGGAALAANRTLLLLVFAVLLAFGLYVQARQIRRG